MIYIEALGYLTLWVTIQSNSCPFACVFGETRVYFGESIRSFDPKIQWKNHPLKSLSFLQRPLFLYLSCFWVIHPCGDEKGIR